MVDQRPRGREGVVAAGADAEDAVGRLDHVAGAGDEQRVLGVDHGDQRFEPPQGAVRPPLLGQFGRGARHVRRVVLQLRFEAFHQGEGVGRGAGEADQHLAVHQPADFHGVAFDDGLAHRHLAVAADGDAAVVANGEDGGGAEFHGGAARLWGGGNPLL